MEPQNTITPYHSVFFRPFFHENLSLLPHSMGHNAPVLDLSIPRFSSTILSNTGACTSKSGSTYAQNPSAKPKKKMPVKAYPKDLVPLAARVTTAEAVVGNDSTEAYDEFWKKMLPHMQPSSTILLSAGPDTSETDSTNSQNASAEPKVTRPFKAYPKNPLSLAAGNDSMEAYEKFRKKMLSQVQQNIGTTNKNMRRSNMSSHNPENADPSYWAKRKKNNEAAKRSRDARRAKEDEIAIRCTFLEQENMKLKYQLAALKDDNERLRRLMYK